MEFDVFMKPKAFTMEGPLQIWKNHIFSMSREARRRKWGGGRGGGGGGGGGLYRKSVRELIAAMGVGGKRKCCSLLV